MPPLTGLIYTYVCTLRVRIRETIFLTGWPGTQLPIRSHKASTPAFIASGKESAFSPVAGRCRRLRHTGEKALRYKIELCYIISMNNNDYLTNTLLNNLVGMNYNGREVTEARLMPYSECREFTDVILVRYGQEINDKIFLHPAYVRYSFLSEDLIVLVERLNGGSDAEYRFTK